MTEVAFAGLCPAVREMVSAFGPLTLRLQWDLMRASNLEHVKLSGRSRRLIGGASIVALILVLLWLLRATRREVYPGIHDDSSAGGTPASSPGAISSPTATPPGGAPASESGAPRTRLMVFVINAAGVEARRSEVVTGRVKARPASSAADRLEFEVYDGAGALVYSGSIDHPLRPSFEVEAEDESGRLRRVEGRVRENEFMLRIPGTLDVAKVRFFETMTDAATDRVTRRQLGEITP